MNEPIVFDETNSTTKGRGRNALNCDTASKHGMVIVFLNTLISVVFGNAPKGFLDSCFFFRVAWSTRSRPKSEQVLRPTPIKHERPKIYFQSIDK